MPLFRPDLVASDLDGTLLPPDLVFAPATAPAIGGLKDAGIAFAICTGRMFRSVRPVAARLGLSSGPVVCYQGAMVVDLATGERLLHRPMPGRLAAEVVAAMRESGFHVNAYIDDQLCVEELDEWARSYAEYAEVGINTVADLAAEVAARPPTKLVVTTTPADARRLMPACRERWGGRLYMTTSLPGYVEFAAPSVNKSATLRWLCDRSGLRRERTVACGDGENDVEMLRWAGLGVAVAEASEEVREAADLVVPRAELPGLFTELAAAPA